MKHALLAGLLVLVPLAAFASEPTPKEIMERYKAACDQLDFKPVAPYIDSNTLTSYRAVTTKIIDFAVKEHGEESVLAFFQGLKNLEDLKNLSDAEYWAYVTASSLQFEPKSLFPEATFLKQINQSNGRVMLIYEEKVNMEFTPDAGTFLHDHVFTFRNENGSWKLVTFAPRALDSSLHWFLTQRQDLKWESFQLEKKAKLLPSKKG